MLLGWVWHLHATGTTYGGMGYISITGNLVRGIDNYHPFLGIIGQHTGYLT